MARTDHQAFGEEIGAEVGLHSTAQGYAANKATRQGYGLTKNDESSGQQHAWFRKLETKAGRWSSPDPYKGSMELGNPQSFNRYSYVENQPTNYVDPSGLDDDDIIRIYTFEPAYSVLADLYFGGFVRDLYMPVLGDPGGGGGDPPVPPPAPKETCGDNLSLADANSDEGSLSRLIFQEATSLARFGNAFSPTTSGAGFALSNYNAELQSVAAVVLNRVDVLNTRSDLNTGFGSRGASVADVVYSRGASGIQFAGFTPKGISDGISKRIDNTLKGSSNSSECSKLKDAIDIARNYRRGTNSTLDQLYAFRTAGSSSPGGNFVRIDGLLGSGNDFYQLSQNFLNPPRRR